MNDTDDAFAFYAIEQLGAAKPAWVSVRTPLNRRSSRNPSLPAPRLKPSSMT